MKQKEIKAVVRSIITESKGGPYAVTTSEEIEGSITFSLEKGVWQEQSFLEVGMVVVLSGLYKKKAGWRATKARLLQPLEEKSKKKPQIWSAISKWIDKALSPLENYKTEVADCYDYGEHIRIGGSFSSHPKKIISHAEYVRKEVLPLLVAAIENFGIEQAVMELLEISLPAYEKINKDDMASFWSNTIDGVPDGFPKERQSFREKMAGKMNFDLAAKLGVKKFYGPILDLAMAHAETQVFSNTGKFFVTHACRMGEMVTRFSYEDYLTYIKLAKRLLRHGIYDWSIEHEAEEWKILTPAIKQFGFEAVLGASVKAMIDLAKIPGTKDCKYKYSYMAWIIDALYPYMVSKALKDGAKTFTLTLDPIVKFIKELHKLRAFTRDGYDEVEFFRTFKQYLPIVERNGIDHLLQSIRSHWVSKLVPRSQ
jgi:hypothetical protein